MSDRIQLLELITAVKKDALETESIIKPGEQGLYAPDGRLGARDIICEKHYG